MQNNPCAILPSCYVLTMKAKLNSKVDIRNCYDVEGTRFTKDRTGLEAAIEFAHETGAAVFAVRGLHREFVWKSPEK